MADLKKVTDEIHDVYEQLSPEEIEKIGNIIQAYAQQETDKWKRRTELAFKEVVIQGEKNLKLKELLERAKCPNNCSDGVIVAIQEECNFCKQRETALNNK